MSYFHERRLTIIGAAAFHGPVRDGKGWYHCAMVVWHKLLPTALAGQSGQFNKKNIGLVLGDYSLINRILV
jgi:hypothetical protein